MPAVTATAGLPANGRCPAPYTGHPKLGRRLRDQVTICVDTAGQQQQVVGWNAIDDDALL